METIISRFKRIIETGEITKKRLDCLIKLNEKLESDDKKIITEIVNSLKIGKLKKTQHMKIQKYVDEYKTKNTTNEIVSAQIKLEETEKELDSHVKKYCGFSEKKPMDYVSYDTTNKKYVARFGNVSKTGKDVQILCDKLLILLKDKMRISYSEIVISSKVYVEYKNKSLIIFATQNALLFDIRHVLSILNIDERMIEKKYKEFSPKITNFLCVKNDFGGYIIRELIPEEVMYEIVLSSNSDFSKSFKKDVSMILRKAREDGKLFVESKTGEIVYVNDEQTKTQINSRRKFLSIEGCENNMTKKVLKASTTEISCVYLFTIGQVKDLRNTMHIDDKYKDDCIVVKYGRTENLRERSQQHNKSFKKFGGDAKLMYYAWIDVEFQSRAEIDIKQHFCEMKVLIKCDEIQELAVLTWDELNNLKKYFCRLSDIYCGKLKNMIDVYKKDLNDAEKKYSNGKHKYEKQVLEFEKRILEIEKQMLKLKCELKNQLLIKDNEMKDQLLIKEKEITKLLTSLTNK